MDEILSEKKGYVALLTINHPPANTWNLATMEAFEHAVDAAEKDPEVRVVIITGAGEKHFSAGFDVKDAANGPIISPKGRRLWRHIDRFPKPVVAAINGYAMGGGLELALACHFRIMADAPKTVLGLTELNLGIIPGWGGTQRLTQVVGRAKALDMILFSKTVTPWPAPKFARARSSARSPFTSPIANDQGSGPAQKCTALANCPSPTPSNTETLLVWLFATARSGT